MPKAIHARQGKSCAFAQFMQPKVAIHGANAPNHAPKGAIHGANAPNHAPKGATHLTESRRRPGAALPDKRPPSVPG